MTHAIAPAPPFGVRGAYALAVLGGAAYFVGYPGIDLWPLAFVAQAMLLVAIRGRAPRDALKLGLVYGTVLGIGGFYWLVPTIEVFGGFPKPLALVLAVALCVYQGGGRIALMTWLAARAAARGTSMFAAYVAAFVTSELLYPLLFPYYVGASLQPVPVLMQVADLGGPILVGLVLVAINVIVAELVLARLEHRAIARRPVLIASVGVASAFVYGAVRIRMIDARVASAERATVGLVQSNIGVADKRVSPVEGVKKHKDLTAKLRAQGPVDFVVWSESSVMYVVPEPELESFHYKRVTKDLGVPVVFGTVLTRATTGEERKFLKERLFNTALATDAQGHVTSRYDKQYLLMFGEYLPLGDTFPILYRWSPNSGRFTPGTSLEPMTIATPSGNRRATMLICYEDILPAFVRSAVRFGAPELLLNVTNDAWFGDTTEPWQHFALAKLRAIEHRRFLIRGTNTGVSAIVDPVGRVTTQSGTFREEILRGEIRWLVAHTVYGVVGDIPYVLFVASALFLAFRRQKELERAG